MGFLRRLFGGKAQAEDHPIINPDRNDDLYALTPEGYVIAQDIACQYEYVEQQSCPYCGGALTVAAQINRSGQGLNELVCACQQCRRRTSVIFDISNDVYQAWLAGQFGKLYVRNYDGKPRKPAGR